jgi:predicted nucleic acid-binding protein
LTSGRFLLDTIVIAFLKGDAQVQSGMDRAAEVFVPAIALERGLTLVTRDAHFGAIDDLRIASWSTPT